MAAEEKSGIKGAYIHDEFICADCLTEEDEAALEGLLSPEEQEEARMHTCKRCQKQVKC